MKARPEGQRTPHLPLQERRRVVVVCTIALMILVRQPAMAEEPEGIEEVILVYGGNLPDWRGYVVELLREDPRLEATILMVNTSDCLSVALLFPNVKAAVLMGQNADVVRRAEAQVLTCFNHGAGLIGFHDFASLEVAPDLAEKVFPLFANVSRLGRVKEGVFVQSLVRQDLHEINEGLPGEIDIRDPEINLALSTRSNKWSGMVPASGELTVLYKDATYGAPIVAAYTDEGSSVSFAGGDIDNSPENKLKYFGNLFFDETFQQLLLNSVAWASEQETRTSTQVPEALAELQRVNDWEEELQDSAERQRAQRATAALAFKVGVNVIGICAIIAIYFKMMRRKND